MKPRARASFCHWPKDSSTPLGPGRAELGVEPRRQPCHYVAGAGAVDRREPPPAPRPCAGHRLSPPCARRGIRNGKNPGTRPPCGLANPRRPSAPGAHRRPGFRPEEGSYILASSLTSVVLPAPFSPTMATTAPAGKDSGHILQHHPGRTRVGEGDMLQAHSLVQCLRAPADRPARPPRRRSLPATPGAASRPSRIRAGSRFRPRWRQCIRTAARPRPAPAAPSWRAPARTWRRRPPRPHSARPKIAQPSRQPPCRAPSRRGHRPIPALPGRPAVADQALANAGDPHFFARRRGGRDGEEVPRQAVAVRPALLGDSLDRRAASPTSAPWERRTPPAAGARDESTPAEPWSRPGAGSTPGWKTATCTCGRARTPGCAAWTGGRDTPGARDAPPSTTVACSCATCDSSAMVTLSRKRRCTRVLTVRRNQVAGRRHAQSNGRDFDPSIAVLKHAFAQQPEP